MWEEREIITEIESEERELDSGEREREIESGERELDSGERRIKPITMISNMDKK